MERKKYIRSVTQDFEPYDPLELTKATEEIVIRGNQRKYSSFFWNLTYDGITTGAAIGCNLRCIFCSTSKDRDYPENFGEFYSPEKAFKSLGEETNSRNTESMRRFFLKGVKEEYQDEFLKETSIKRLRLSSCEPTIGLNHLLSLLQLVENSDFPKFILETNGIILGNDKSYVEEISKFKKVYCRVSLKGGTPEAFREKTGAIESAFYLPFKALEYLLSYGVKCHAAAITDPRLMTESEKGNLLGELGRIDKRLEKRLEEEELETWSSPTKRRLKAALGEKAERIIQN